MRAEEKSFQRIILLLVAGACMLFALLIVQYFSRYMLPKFSESEYEAIHHDAKIVHNIANNHIALLLARMQPLIIWDTAYAFTEGSYDYNDFVSDSLDDDALLSEHWHLCIWLNAEGVPIFGRKAVKDSTSPSGYHYEPLDESTRRFWEKALPLCRRTPAPR